MLRFYISILGCALLALPVTATPVRFTWTSEVDDVTPAIAIPGVSFGNQVTVDVIVDNGGSSLNSQTWLGSHIISAQVSIASYSANFVSAFIPVGNQPVFETNSSGELTSVLFVGTGVSANNTDSLFGPSAPRLLNNSIKASQSGEAYFVDRFVGPNPNDLVGWDLTPEVVPEPSTALMIVGFAAVGFCRLRT
jgi:hypothetical protein